MTARRVLAVLAALAIAAACVFSGQALWDTVVPENLKLPAVGEEEFDPKTVDRAEDYETVARWLAIGSQLALLIALGLYARRGHRFMRESTAGPIGTGVLLGMIGFCVVWLVQLPFSLADFALAKRYDLAKITSFEWFFEDFFALTGVALQVSLVLAIVMAILPQLFIVEDDTGTSAVRQIEEDRQAFNQNDEREERAEHHRDHKNPPQQPFRRRP